MSLFFAPSDGASQPAARPHPEGAVEDPGRDGGPGQTQSSEKHCGRLQLLQQAEDWGEAAQLIMALVYRELNSATVSENLSAVFSRSSREKEICFLKVVKCENVFFIFLENNQKNKSQIQTTTEASEDESSNSILLERWFCTMQLEQNAKKWRKKKQQN